MMNEDTQRRMAFIGIAWFSRYVFQRSLIELDAWVLNAEELANFSPR
jgi:hypothetical protein